MRTTPIALLCLLVLLAGATMRAAEAPRVLVRWHGGQLTLEDFTERYDPNGRLLGLDPEDQRREVAKAVYQEIYAARGRAAGLDRNQGFLDELAAWRTSKLAARYRVHHGPKRSDASPEQLRQYYSRHRDSRFTTAGSADLEVLFVRCVDDEHERSTGRTRMASSQERVLTGETMETVINEERVRSGAANGLFEDVPLTRLEHELATAVRIAEVGGTTPVIETPIGLFWVRVLRRTDPLTRPFAQVEKRARNLWYREQLASWEAQEIVRLRRQFGDTQGETNEALLAAAAREAGLDQQPSFQRAERSFARWRLADLAFSYDSEVLPSDEELAVWLARHRDSLRQHRLLIALVTGSGGSFSAHLTAEMIREELALADDPAFLLRQLPGRFPAVVILDRGLLDHRELDRVNVDLYKTVAELAEGEVKGPIALRNVAVAAGQRSSGLAFVLITGRRDPPLEELRPALYKRFRDYISSGVEVFLERVGSRWGVELFPDGMPSASELPETAHAAAGS